MLFKDLLLLIVCLVSIHNAISFNILKGLQWRQAKKTFVPVDPATVDIQPVLEAIRLAPSSFGIQPYYVHVITNQEIKNRLVPACHNQKQVAECSHLLLFATQRYADEAVERFLNSSGVAVAKPEYAEHIRATGIDKMICQHFYNFATHQVMIALGIAIAACAELGLSSCPMTGFSPDLVYQYSGIPGSHRPAALLAIGSTKDPHDPDRPRFRLTMDDLVWWHK